MHPILVLGFGIVGLCVAIGCWLGWQLLRQNGRILLRLDEIEQRIEELEFGESDDAKSAEANGESKALAEAEPGAQDRADRFKNRSLVRSHIQRDGLKAGTSAPSFRLPLLDGGELSLEELRGKRALLIFSDPHCGPCNALAPQLEKFHRDHPEIGLVMISRGEPKENRVKVKEHGLTFPIVLQQRWEISRLYAMFATPVAYLIDEAGIIVGGDVAVGVEAVQALLRSAEHQLHLPTENDRQHLEPRHQRREVLQSITSSKTA